MNETGSYPGQPWLWLYTLWYQVPGWTNSANIDMIAVYMTGLATILLLLRPVHPRPARHPPPRPRAPAHLAELGRLTAANPAQEPGPVSPRAQTTRNRGQAAPEPVDNGNRKAPGPGGGPGFAYLALNVEPTLAVITVATAAIATGELCWPSSSQPASVARAGSRLSRMPKTRRGMRRIAANSSV